MKRCLNCQGSYPTSEFSCPNCGTSPVILSGFPAYAPALAQEGGGFKASYFEELAKLEANHFWFRVRNLLIIWAIKRYTRHFQSFLEIGCGTGFVLSGIANNFPLAQLKGAEIFTAGLSFASARQPAIGFMQMDARAIPFIDEFDAIGAFDVLEHIEEDEKVLNQIHGALKMNGIMLLTVPQHAWLWSPIDDAACHVRRYSAQDLHKKVENAGFRILRSTSFVSALLPAMWLSRFRQRLAKNIDHSAELNISPRLNWMFEKILSAEAYMIRNGANLPWGGSRLIVARKK